MMQYPPALPQDSSWLSISQAAQLLGVHPSTLRRWADEGEIRCLRTPGGHRRFLESDLQRFLETHRQAGFPPTQETLVQSLVHQTRREMAEESIDREPWYTAFDEGSRTARRESGRRLLGLAIKYTLRTSGRETILEEGRRVGRRYGRDAVERGLSLTHMARAFLFFREALIRAARPGLSTQGQYDAEEIHIHRSLREFLDQVLFAALEAYERALHNLLPTGETG